MARDPRRDRRFFGRMSAAGEAKGGTSRRRAIACARQSTHRGLVTAMEGA